MLDLMLYHWATLHPAMYAAIAAFALLVGYLAGLYGYAQASRDAYRRFVIAQQRPAVRL